MNGWNFKPFGRLSIIFHDSHIIKQPLHIFIAYAVCSATSNRQQMKQEYLAEGRQNVDEKKSHEIGQSTENLL
jgi:hypothetical protein